MPPSTAKELVQRTNTVETDVVEMRHLIAYALIFAVIAVPMVVIHLLRRAAWKGRREAARPIRITKDTRSD